ncbi:unnamed protein product, partial [Porites lobata]
MKMSLPYEPYKLPPSAATSVRIESDDDEDDDGDEEEDYPGEGAKAFYLSQRITSDHVLHEITGKLQGWRSIILKQSAVLRNEHYLQECEQRITREDLQAFLRSPVVAEAEALFGADGNRRGSSAFHELETISSPAWQYRAARAPKALETATLEHFKHARR